MAQLAGLAPGAPVQYSPDGQWYWDGRNWQPASQLRQQPLAASTAAAQSIPKKRGFWTKKKIGGGIIGLIVLGIIGSVASNSGSPSTQAAANKASTTTSQRAQAAAAPAKAAPAQAAPAKAAPAKAAPAKAAPAAPAGPTLTNQQQNAARSAQQYLTMEGFSRQGLIDQLSSSAGDGYSVQDATVAVDSLKVDWNAQAVRSAKQYLQMQAFSCNGLIQQLDSSSGDQYTVAQATYGAQQAGAC